MTMPTFLATSLAEGQVTFFSSPFRSLSQRRTRFCFLASFFFLASLAFLSELTDSF